MKSTTLYYHLCHMEKFLNNSICGEEGKPWEDDLIDAYRAMQSAIRKMQRFDQQEFAQQERNGAIEANAEQGRDAV